MSLDQQQQPHHAQPATPAAAPQAEQAPSRKATTGDLAGSVSDVGPKVSEEDQQQAVDPAQTAEEGFQGTPVELPHRAQMERSFGVSFAGVRAYTDQHAKRANLRMGSQAYAHGSQIAFSMANPPPDLVAHELTHVLQKQGGRGGIATKSDGAGGGGYETSGEGEAENVEAAVRAGKPARSALQGENAGKEGAGKEAAPSSTSAGPARKEKPARSVDKFGTGMTFSTTGLEKYYRYELWKAGPIEIPIGAVPGLNFMVEPAVNVVAAGGVDWKKHSVKAKLGVEGGVGVGLSYGNHHVAEVYGAMEASVGGGFEYEKEQAEHGHPGKWSLEGAISLSTNFAVGVRVGGGILDTKFQFGKCDVGKLTGLCWENGHFDRKKIGWTWGEQPKAAFEKIKHVINEAKRIAGLPKAAAQNAWKGLKNGVGAIGGLVKHFHLPHFHMPDLNPFN